LVWKKQHKFHFIETILLNYPFPEVYIASAEMDVDAITASEVVVDGQQRLSTIVDYIKGIGDFKKQIRISPFGTLHVDEKKKFLNYLVSVRDLKNMDIDEIKAIFMRINNTEYSLNTIEKINAQYGDGEYLIFCKQLIETAFTPTSDETEVIINTALKYLLNSFFDDNGIFSENDMKRMYNLQYIMTIIANIIEGEYSSRNSKAIEYMEKYNNYFDKKSLLEPLLSDIISFLNKVKLTKDSYFFNKANLFTLIVELSKADIGSIKPQKLTNELNLMEAESKQYWAGIDISKISNRKKKYYDHAKEGVNSKTARKYRGKIISELINKCSA